MAVIDCARGPNRTYIETCDVCAGEYVAHQRGSHYCSKTCNMRAVQVLGIRVRPRLRDRVIVCALCGEDWPCVGFLRGLPGHARSTTHGGSRNLTSDPLRPTAFAVEDR